MRTERNVHERVVEAPAEVVGALLDRLSSPDDPIAPSPVWPPFRFDRPLGVGADGGHGFVRYRVTVYEPGRAVRFDFPPPADGYHTLTVEPLDAGRCRITHVFHEEQGIRQALLWSLAIEPLHDVMIEELFDNVVRAATPDRPLRPTRRSTWARLMHRAVWDRPKAVPFPAAAVLGHEAYDRPDFTDSWQLPLRPGMPTSPEAWRGVLPYEVRASAPRELLLGEDASHLDFRASVLIENDTVTLTTVVRTHNLRGRLYWSVVRRVHPFMARLMLVRTHRRLAYAAPPAPVRLAREAAAPPSG
ncbi:DUF2867 domain-containing protein [Streptomyces sp. ISL-10]|uniref:DUF2867 domain-containing protein n=1 Tax=Streptomyces sp. ISL-10 TaxID=2819172 RepID=UPI001BEAD005|nr:DUF2867 domain-containing protein [Streptomyces sp. ISL-10]MBT2365366.1 DUF2867 domain-containing protein [Streptomyces sp. ISL-10]